MKRILPSGLDLAAAFGSTFAGSLLASEYQAYPNLKRALGALSTLRPTTDSSTGMYERWLGALSVQWSDSATFPGVASGSLWSAKRLQTGLASWATLRHATVLVNRRAAAAEAGEGGFEELL